MMYATLIPDEQMTNMGRLRQIFSWLFRSAIIVALVALVMATVWQAETLFNVSILFVIAAGMFGARLFLDRGQLNLAIITFYGLLVAAMPAGLAGSDQPVNILTALALVPVLALAVVLPYSSDALLRRLMIAGWLGLVVATIYVHVILYHGGMAAGFVKNFTLMVLILSVDAFILLLLWLYRRRLIGMVEQLQAAHSGLEQQVAEQTIDLRVALAEAERLQEVGTEQRLHLERTADELTLRVAAEQAAQSELLRARELEQERHQALELAVAEYLSFARRIATGDLSQRLAVRHNGALGELGHGLNLMVESLQQLTGELREASGEISATAGEILEAATRQAASAVEQSSAISETTATIEEVKAIAQQTAQQAEQVTAGGRGALQVAREGMQVVEETVEGMQVIRSQVSSISETILELADQNETIGSIIATVGEIADQSNLLALNAAIEAARAGEQGKSFAIVAQQVRELAERSKRATAQVREILGDIQRVTNRAVFATEEGSKGVEAWSRRAAEAGRVLHRIAEEVESSVSATLQMASAAQQQTAGMEQIGSAMKSIQDATTSGLASTRQTERASRDLNALAGSLQKAIESYRL